MTVNILPPKTYLGNDNVWKLQLFLQKMFRSEAPETRVEELTAFLCSHPLPVDDFPLLDGTYSRTVLYREENGFEAMAARWDSGTVSAVHGHPYFNLYFVAEGRLKVDDYTRSDEGLRRVSTSTVRSGQVSSFTGEQGAFDNDIHQVHALEETLSIHISSDDSSKGEIFG